MVLGAAFGATLLPPLRAAGAQAASTAAPAVRKAEAPDERASGDSADVAATVARFHAALERGDSAAVLVLLAPGATILESGAVETVAEYRAHHLPSDIEFARAVPSRRGPMHVTVRGDVAWAVGSSTTQGQFRDRPVNTAGAELMVLERSFAGWRIAAIHWSSRRRQPQ